MSMKWLLILAVLGIMITPALAISPPNPPFTNITDLGSPACGIDYTDIGYFKALARDANGTYWAGIRRTCGGSANGVLGIYESADNGTTWTNLANTTVCTGDVGSAASVEVFSMQNELYDMSYCGSLNAEVLNRLNKTDGSVITAVNVGGQSKCTTNSTAIWCLITSAGSGGGDIILKVYDESLNLLNTFTCGGCRPELSSGGFSPVMSRQDFMEYVFWSGFNTAYYANVTADGNFSNFTATGLTPSYNHGWDEALVVLPDGTKMIASNTGTVKSTDGIIWSLTSVPISVIVGVPHILKYGTSAVITYSNGTALQFVESDDSGVTWELPVSIFDTPSQGYAASSRGQNFPTYANDTAHAGYLDLLIGTQTNNDVYFDGFLFRDVVAPEVEIQQPVGTVAASFGIKYTVSHESVLNSSIDQCWYSIDSGANVSLPSCGNTTGTASIGAHSISIYSNDTIGNTGFTESSFTVRSPPVSGSGAVVYSIIPLLFLLMMITIGAALMFYGSKQSDVHTVITGFIILFVGIIIFGIINGFIISQV